MRTAHPEKLWPSVVPKRTPEIVLEWWGVLGGDVDNVILGEWVFEAREV